MVSTVAALLAAPQAALAGLAAVDAGPRPPDSITTIQLRMHPKAEPRPALRYRFDFPFMEQYSGNGALQYNTALYSLVEIKASDATTNDTDWTEWLKMPPAEIPAEEAGRFVDRFSNPIKYAELAARCESCDWEYPVREMGMGTLMPGLSDMRYLWRVLALKTRLATNADNIPEAMRSLRIGFAMTTDLGEAGLLIHNLVAAAGAGLMLDQVETLIQNPQSPNLYWALTSLPDPMIDFSKSVKTESEYLYTEFPELAELDQHVLSNEEVIHIWQKFAQMYTEWATSHRPLVMLATESLKLYPVAKQWLCDQGLSAETVDAMPPLYVVLRYEYYHFTCFRDDICKWFAVPYWQAAGQFTEAQDRNFAARETGEPGGMFADAMSAYARVAYLRARLERDIAILRCVEAIRIYGAAHNGRFPPSLDDITEVPVPVDPFSGRAFTYEFRNDMAVLESPAPSGEHLRDGIRYEIFFE
jgi:hypothetical protein